MGRGPRIFCTALAAMASCGAAALAGASEPERRVAESAPAASAPAADNWGDDSVYLFRGPASGIDDAYCGPASLYLFLRLAGRDSPPFAELCAELGSPDALASLASLQAAARRHGLRGSVAFRVRPDAIASMPLPAIAFRRRADGDAGHGHFVVLARREGDFIQVIDPRRYAAWVPLERLRHFSKTWQGEVLLSSGRVEAWRAVLIGALSVPAAFGVVWMLIRGFMTLRRRILRGRTVAAS